MNTKGEEKEVSQSENCTNSSTDDVYEGKLIPKGTTVFLGIWAMHHDEKMYPNHDQFDPDRFLNHTKLANEYAASSNYENRDKLNSTNPHLKPPD